MCLSLYPLKTDFNYLYPLFQSGVVLREKKNIKFKRRNTQENKATPQITEQLTLLVTGLSNTLLLEQNTHYQYTWGRHQMETFSALLANCAGNSPVNSPHKGQWRGALVFFYLRLNKRLSKQSWGWWLETLSRPLWRHRNEHISV